MRTSVAHQEFHRWERQLQRWVGHKPFILAILPENCMEMKQTFYQGGGRTESVAPLPRSANGLISSKFYFVV